MRTERGSELLSKDARSPSLFIYAVIDLASAPELSPVIMGQQWFQAQPLFTPETPIEVLSVGPWLSNTAHLPDLMPILDAYDEGVPWGFLVHASIDIVSLRRTLRRFNTVEIPNPRRTVLFRYWDPRVMATFLQVATRQQKTLLFEFIDRIEGPKGSFDARYDDI
jgi:hypothetical protein